MSEHRSSAPWGDRLVVALMVAALVGLLPPVLAHGQFAVTTVDVGGATVHEGDDGTTLMRFDVVLRDRIDTAVTVQYETVPSGSGSAHATEGVDYLDRTGSLTFQPGDVRPGEGPILVPVIGDTSLEGDEIFHVKLSPPPQTVILGVGTGVGRIIDDDDPALALTYPSGAALPSEGGTAAVFAVEAENINPFRDMTVDWRTIDPVAVEAAQPALDYARVARATVTIPRGSTTTAVAVPLLDDPLDEGPEDLTVALIADSAGGAEVDPTPVTVAIQDDDFPVLSIASGSPVLEPGGGGLATATFDLVLSRPLTAPATLKWETVQGTASGDADFTAVPPTELSLTPGAPSGPIEVEVLGDDIAEGDEAFQVRLSAPAGVQLGQALATTTILDSDTPPTVSIGDAQSVTEGSGTPALFPVRLNRAAASDVEVTLVVLNGSASGSDYTVTTSTVTLQAGETTADFPVAIVDDGLAEDHETFHVDIVSATGGVVLGSPTRATATIVSNDGPIATVAAPQAVVEGDGTGTTQMRFPVTLSGGGHTDTVRVAFTTVSGTATTIDSDFIPTAGVLAFPVGTTQQFITVLVAADDRIETDETVQVVLSDPRYGRLGIATAAGTITDDDDFPRLVIGDVRVQEGDSGTTQAVFRVGLSDTTDADVTFEYRTDDGTAISGTGDYTSQATSRFVPAGQAFTDITVDVTADVRPEINETFSLLLVRARNAGFPVPVGAETADQARRGVGTILNDDGPHLRIIDASTLEGLQGETHTLGLEVLLIEGGPSTVTVSFATEDGDLGDDGATGGSTQPFIDADFVHNAGTITFAPGETTRTVPVSVVGDGIDEATEWFRVRLSDAATASTVTTATLLDDEGIGTIINDDGPEITIADTQVLEGDSGRTAADVTVSLSQASQSGNDVTVDYEAQSGSAFESVDFDPTAGTLTIPAGSTQGIVTVPVIGDTFAEGDHAFTVRLSRPRFAALAGDTATVTIIDDDDGGGGTTTGGTTGGTSGGTTGSTSGGTGGTGEATTGEATTGEATTGTTTGGTNGGAAPLPDRSAGDDRIATAVAVSRDHWAGAAAVVLATARNYPDALAATAVAHGLQAPLLLTPVDQLPPDVEVELGRLGATEVWIMGGPLAVSQAVEVRLREMGYDVIRIAGRDRFETAALAAHAIGLPSTGEVSVAIGRHELDARAWPDALSAGSLAAGPGQLPTLLTRSDLVPSATSGVLSALGAREVILIGGPAAITSDVVAELRGSGYVVTRLQGATRYGTSAAVADAALARHEPGRVPIVFATGEDYPDALTAGALAAQLGGVVLLVPGDDLERAPEIGAFLRDRRARLGHAVIVGGPAVVSEAVRQQLADALGNP